MTFTFQLPRNCLKRRSFSTNSGNGSSACETLIIAGSFISIHPLSPKPNNSQKHFCSLIVISPVVTRQTKFESYKKRLIIVGRGKIMALGINTSKFKFIGGDVSLDFVNTVNGRISSPNKKGGRDYYDAFVSDKLNNYADLLAWSLKAGLIKEGEAENFLQVVKDDEQAANTIYKRALNLRESTYRLFKSSIEGWQPEVDDLEKLNRELSIARRHQKLSAAKNSFAFKWLNRNGSLDLMLWQISESAVHLLINGDFTRICRCENDVCNWLFIDTSRNRSRQWCVMKDCGNVAKVRRFRAKQQAEQ
jgi:predicted RNA-binding Zn ribbon-like protein